jgi:formiminoglutamate deiminase
VSAYWLAHAVVDGDVQADVRVSHDGGVITAVSIGAAAEPGDVVRDGLTLPGIANAHSHAFHRALRGRTHGDGGDFWAWRERMYAAAARLDPERYRALATAFFAELLQAGYTAVGEFHYVHGPRSAPDPTTVMAEAVTQAARDTGIRLTLLHTLYRHGGRDDAGRALPLAPEQRAFGDRDVDVWLGRHERIAVGGTVRRGAAVHSLRAVDPDDIARVAASIGGEPLHAHVSEQPVENAQVAAAFGRTPVAVLRDAGALGPRFTAVHATHLTDADIADLAGSTVCACPTTERDLADGIGPLRALADAGARLAIGSDQHAVVDPFDELRALEGHERLRTGRRGRFSPRALLDAATVDGYRSLGWIGGIAVGAACDLVTVATASPRTAGADLDQLWLAASAADVTDVIVAGEPVVSGGVSRAGDVGAMLDAALREVR